MKVPLVIIALLFVPFISFSQVDQKATVFRSAKDFQEKSGLACKDYIGTTNVGFKYYAHFSSEGRNLRFKWEQIWGFEWRGDLFRCGPYDMPVRLIEEGAVCFWQAGSIYISKGLQGELITIAHADRDGHRPAGKRAKEYLQLQKSEPALAQLCDCIDTSIDRVVVRHCVDEFNKGSLVDLEK